MSFAVEVLTRKVRQLSAKSPIRNDQQRRDQNNPCLEERDILRADYRDKHSSLKIVQIRQKPEINPNPPRGEQGDLQHKRYVSGCVRHNISPYKRFHTPSAGGERCCERAGQVCQCQLGGRFSRSLVIDKVMRRNGLRRASSDQKM